MLAAQETEPTKSSLDPLALVGLERLMRISCGNEGILVGLIDGPVALGHPDLLGAKVRELPGQPAACARLESSACVHGTFVAGILCAMRGSRAPSICPGCSLLLRPIFAEQNPIDERMPTSTPLNLSAAICECVRGGVRVLNLSVGLASPSCTREHDLEAALNYAASQGVIVVAAAGNQSTLGTSAITRHPWVIPVAACDLYGKPISSSNLSSLIGKNGLMAPGTGITSLAACGGVVTSGGTSIAAPFVTGALALLWSTFPSLGAREIKMAVMSGASRRGIVPPLLNAEAAYQALRRVSTERSLTS
jgi:subtilisin family serine protease